MHTHLKKFLYSSEASTYALGTGTWVLGHLKLGHY